MKSVHSRRSHFRSRPARLNWLLGILLAFCMGSLYAAEEATLNGIVITVPVLEIENQIFRVELTFVVDPDSDFIDFDLTDSQPLINANRTGASIIIQDDDAGLIVGVLNQYRYWTRSRARLLAADILRDHFTVFENRR